MTQPAIRPDVIALLVDLVTGPKRTELAELLDRVAPDGGSGPWLRG